jgi:hypothetical protein
MVPTGIIIRTNNTSCVLIRISATLCAVPKIAVTYTDTELARVRRSAGEVPLSTWIRNRTLELSQPEVRSNGSASHQDLSGVPESSVSGRRTGASRRGSKSSPVHRNGSGTNRKSGVRSVHGKASTEKPVSVLARGHEFEADSLVSQIVTKENFAEVMATMPTDEVDRWARSLPQEVLPSHGTDWRTCMCGTCLQKRKNLGVAYGDKPKVGKR